ncbi:uncharacterized protein LOC122639140 [Telopea speciosissima]|uniref:uncharacterized protein LOC122639140 n=1 Tax=Telopea speciosissima TaxID=54955 RepID=UPI001CC616AA|nr:uncharacterized protein LOC122639140 [Telopea speciosissima]
MAANLAHLTLYRLLLFPHLSPTQLQTPRRQDQIILNWIISSLTKSALALIVRLTSSHASWSTLECTYASHSQARIMQLKYQLFQLKKGTPSMAEYLQRVKSLADNLAAAANPVPNSDIILSNLHGLGPNYESFATSMTTRIDPIPLDNFTGLLLTQEILKDQRTSHMDLPSVEALVTTKSAGTSSNRGHGYSNNGTHGRGRGHYYNRGRGQYHSNQ